MKISFRKLLIKLPKTDILDLIDDYNEYIIKVNNTIQENNKNLEIYSIEKFYNETI